MAKFTRRAALAALGASAAVGVGYVVRLAAGPPFRIRLADCGGMMGAGQADMRLYMDMFNRHTEITRTVEETPAASAPRPSQRLPISLRNCTSTCRACMRIWIRATR